MSLKIDFRFGKDELYIDLVLQVLNDYIYVYLIDRNALYKSCLQLNMIYSHSVRLHLTIYLHLLFTKLTVLSQNPYASKAVTVLAFYTCN